MAIKRAYYIYLYTSISRARASAAKLIWQETYAGNCIVVNEWASELYVRRIIISSSSLWSIFLELKVASWPLLLLLYSVKELIIKQNNKRFAFKEHTEYIVIFTKEPRLIRTLFVCAADVYNISVYSAASAVALFLFASFIATFSGRCIEKKKSATIVTECVLRKAHTSDEWRVIINALQILSNSIVLLSRGLLCI